MSHLLSIIEMLRLRYRILSLKIDTNQFKVYKLFYFCSDLVFTLVFPHLTTALFCPEWVNPLGSAVAFVFGALMR